MMVITIRLQPEYIISFHGVLITNTFFTSILTTFVLIALGLIFYFNQESEMIVIKAMRVYVVDLLHFIDSVTHDRVLSKKIFPLIATLFVFIGTANLLELIPGFSGSFVVRTGGTTVPFLRSPNSDLTTTIALALCAVASIQYFSISVLGIASYIQRFLNISGIVQCILGFFEILSEIIKTVSFSFRLFGNMFAGEVLLLVVSALIPYIIPLPFMILEVFVGIIQAFIFAALTLTFIKTSSVRMVEMKPVPHHLRFLDIRWLTTALVLAFQEWVIILVRSFHIFGMISTGAILVLIATIAIVTPYFVFSSPLLGVGIGMLQATVCAMFTFLITEITFLHHRSKVQQIHH
ncbi:MAG: F0F1 ATP synthase subunit A [Patescibacteria group bacterium]|nr:F0F1 ATP synthase subunit A [Patescibacteria group bacterium]MDE2438264.1 F0F1 ATP synthase subunit A [Patescibacteria group bacterium]